jgi:hypothetical protein
MAPPIPTLVPLPPQRGDPLSLARSPFWLGSRADCGHRLYLPGIAQRHVALVERADGYWLTPGDGTATVNGQPAGSGVLLQHGDVLELAPACQFRFDAGVVQAQPAVVPEAPIVERGGGRRRRPKGMAGRRFSTAFRVAVIAVIVLVAASTALIVRAVTRASSAIPLTTEDAALFDSLLATAYDHIERGNTLLEVGAPSQALLEFAAGINALRTSRLRDNPYVVPRIEALEGSVAAIYREKRVAVPAAYARASGSVAVVARSLRAALSTSDFARAFDGVRQRFRERFGDSLVVTGADHAEHVSLYGRGGALDLRSRTLSPVQLGFIVDQCRAAGIRVKDFSQDSVLQRQIRAAMAAGLSDRAGTGLHLHIDRFANRRDAYTVQ